MRTEAILEVLTEAKALGFLGPGDPASHIEHALGFADAVRRSAPVPDRLADLGTGGGVPGLVLAECWPDTEVCCIESSSRRSRALVGWVEGLGLAHRVRILEGRAEDWGRDSEFRERFDLVTARSFARPAVTAEIGSGLVRVGGRMVVSEPPAGDGRWPADRLADLGFGPAVVVEARGSHYACISKAAPAQEDVPRRSGRPGKRPLW
jgi:16S rRNA (guanine527-N7)-methyltransferase